MRIDLGCGKNKFRECIGIDKMDYAETDIVHDINQGLPFDDNSVDFVMASHSLQYVDDLQAVLNEIYRICRHKAVVCIVAPYAHVTSHIVNPHYKQLFNEHSPRYWTKYAGKMPDSDEFLFSPTDKWSLWDEESSLPIDFRVLRMEFFYFPLFRSGYEPFELTLLRQSQLNVAFQIMYQLLVVKEPIRDDDILMLKESMWFEEPDYVKAQRSIKPWENVEERPFHLEYMSPILQSRNTDIEFPVKRKVLKHHTRNRSIFKHRVRRVLKKRRYRRSVRSKK
ncbi:MULTISPECIES: methyltransferase domain-containing protein [Paenibacillus]|uniref:methyltransferase domain-containing protein n=1 Tax=Paenibacillus TaxID=44249 RepID=UPI001643D1F1|nr:MULTISPECIES: class I SAM-dependent methyltransferase [Paenibacillus]MBJ9992297.1 methyltransferase domain-containing protein [Paenibacillus sp. S28]